MCTWGHWPYGNYWEFGEYGNAIITDWNIVCVKLWSALAQGCTLRWIDIAVFWNVTLCKLRYLANRQLVPSKRLVPVYLTAQFHWWVCVMVTLLTHVQEKFSFNVSWISAVWMEDVNDFLSIQPNIRIVSWFCNDCYFPYPFQIVSHLSSIIHLVNTR
jgi:hypothetical protein